MKCLDINVVGQNMTITNTNNKAKFVEGSQKFVYFKFTFDESWNGLTVFAQFIQNETGYNVYLDNENGAYLPAEIEHGMCLLVLYGTGGDIVATTNCLVLTIDNYKLIGDPSSTEITPTLYEQMVNLVKAAISTPLIADSVSEMIDETKIYVYVGHETGYTNGNWYFFNGEAWVSGGAYNGAAVVTDKTLAVEDSAADGKAVGDAIAEIYTAISELTPGGSDIPDWSSSDNGKVLTIVEDSGEYNPSWENVDSLPPFSGSDTGRVLTVVESSVGYEYEARWMPPSGGGGGSDVPSHDLSDSGKVLGVNDYGNLEWTDTVLHTPSSSPNNGQSLVYNSADDALSWEYVLPELDPWYSNTGKVLMINESGAPEWLEPEKLPDYSYLNAGEVLTADGNGGLMWDYAIPGTSGHWENGIEFLAATSTGAAWANPFPNYDSSDAGRVLAVNEYGSLEWVSLT